MGQSASSASDTENHTVRVRRPNKVPASSPVPKKGPEGIGQISRVDNLPSDTIQVTMAQPVQKASDAEQKKRLNEVLHPANMNLYGREACMEGTCRKIIDPILSWADNMSSPSTNICWLYGDAGLGKSAIAKSVAEERQELCVAHLFFDRNNPTLSHPSLVIRTIAYQLAINHSDIRPAILDVIEQNHEISSESLADQFIKLLRDPLTACQHQLGSPLLVILDGLDECGDAKSRRVFVDLIAKKFTSLPSQVKFLITSRPEPDIIHPFETTSPNENRIVRVELLPSSEDVLKFLEVAMRRILEDRPSCRLRVYWPGRPTMLKLLLYMQGVFILASTVVSFVEDTFHPQTSLEYLLMSNAVSSTERLDCLFATVLESIGDWEDASFVDEFQAIVGTVVAGQVPMTVKAIDQLLGLKHSSSTMLSSLRFLLRYSETQPIRTLHASIAEYLTDPERCRDRKWFIHIPDRHRFLVRCCLRLMKERLRFNICDLETSHLLNECVPGLQYRVQTSIPESLVYACQYFSTHLELSNTKPSDFDGLPDLEYFMRSQLLFWLEALSLAGENQAATPAMNTLEQWYWDNNKDMADLAHEIVKFMRVFQGIISQSTPHLYISALPMWSESSAIRRMYGHKLKRTVRRNKDGDGLIPSLQNVIRGHTSSVASVCFLPGGKRVVSGSVDKTVRVWDAETGSVVASFEDHTDRVTSIGFSPDGKRVVSGSKDMTVQIWNAETGSVVTGPFRVYGDTHSVCSVGFSPDGKRIVSGYEDATVRIWDAEKGSRSPLASRYFQENALGSVLVGFSPDRKRIVTGYGDTVKIWDPEAWSVVASFERHTARVTSVAFSPDGTRVVSASEDKTVQIWNATTGSVVAGPFEVDDEMAMSVGFSPDGQRIVSGYTDQMVRIWDASTESIVAGPFEGHTEPVISVGFSPDGKRVVSGSEDHTVRIWDAEARSCGPVEGHTGGVQSIGFSVDGERVVSGSSDSMVRIWDAKAGSVVAGPFKGHTGPISSVGFSPDGKRVVSGSQDRTVLIWDSQIGSVVAGPFKGHNGWVTSVEFSPDGKRFVSASADKTVRVWDVEAGSAERFSRFPGPVSSARFSPNSQRIVIGYSNEVQILDLETKSAVAGPFKEHTKSVTSVGFSPDGKRVVSGSSDNTVRIWDAMTGQVIAGPFNGHTEAVTSVAYSRDGRRVVSGSKDHTVRIWDARTGSQALVAGPFNGHIEAVTSVAFSPDGKYILSGSEDRTLRIWDAPARFNSREADRNACAWKLDDDGCQLRSASGALVLWVPHYPRTSLCFPPATMVMGVRMIQFDTSCFVDGERWTECFDDTCELDLPRHQLDMTDQLPRLATVR